MLGLPVLVIGQDESDSGLLDAVGVSNVQAGAGTYQFSFRADVDFFVERIYARIPSNATLKCQFLPNRQPPLVASLPLERLRRTAFIRHFAETAIGVQGVTIVQEAFPGTSGVWIELGRLIVRTGTSLVFHLESTTNRTFEMTLLARGT